MELIINDRIRNRKFEFFNSFQMDLDYNSVGSTFKFDFFYDYNNKEHKEAMCIGHYHICEVSHLNETLIKGVILTQTFESTSEKKMVSIQGYSTTGVLQDCNLPTDLYPLQSIGMSVLQIVQKICNRFKIDVIVDSEARSKANEVLSDSSCGVSDTISGYLNKLCGQKGLVLSHNEKGNLVITKAKTNQKPILDFDLSQGNTVPYTTMKLVFSGQQIYSHITVIKESGTGEDKDIETEYTIRNPFVIGSVYRPKTIVMSSGEDENAHDVAMKELANQLGNITLEIEIDRWDLQNKGIIKPNNIVSVLNPEIYLFGKTNWFIESASYKGDMTQPTAVLKCVLPEKYNGKVPEYIWKGINLH